MKALFLGPSQRLVGVQREWHTRKRNGKDVCWLLLDRHGKVVCMAQRIRALSEWVNENLATEPWTKVSTSGLYDLADVEEGRIGGFHKGRWRLMSVDLADASDTFERTRSGYEQAAIVGDATCYRTA